MIIDEYQIINNAKSDFEEFVYIIINKKKYFYWSLDYFERMEFISFKQYNLTSSQKIEINKIGKKIFLDKKTIFSIKTNSIRNELVIKNIQKIPMMSKSIEFIMEYTLFKILSKMNEEIIKKTNNENNENDEEIIETYKNEQVLLKRIIAIQKNNFIYTCLKYFIKVKEPFSYVGFNKFGSLNKHAEFINRHTLKIDFALKERINNLWLNKDFEHNMTFLFNLSSDDDKEELRFALENLTKESRNNTELYFRGQANSNWSLKPSIARSEKLLKSEKGLFHKILALKPNDFKNDNTDYERLITMQHYQLPTRLLDITRNPLVSLYFACSNWDRRQEDGLVYIFEENEKNVFLNPDDKKVDCLTKIVKSSDHLICQNCTELTTCDKVNFLKSNYFIRGIAKNKRIDNQSGDFIFVGVDDTSKENKDVEKLVSEYLIIDYKVKTILIDNLEVMNVHGGSVYPELGNMSNYLHNKYK